MIHWMFSKDDESNWKKIVLIVKCSITVNHIKINALDQDEWISKKYMRLIWRTKESTYKNEPLFIFLQVGSSYNVNAY